MVFPNSKPWTPMGEEAEEITQFKGPL